MVSRSKKQKPSKEASSNTWGSPTQYELGMVVARVVHEMKATNDQTLRTLSVIEGNLMRRDLDTPRVDVVVCLVRTLEAEIKRMQEQLAGLPAELDPPVAPGTGS